MSHTISVLGLPCLLCRRRRWLSVCDWWGSSECRHHQEQRAEICQAHFICRISHIESVYPVKEIGEILATRLTMRKMSSSVYILRASHWICARRKEKYRAFKTPRLKSWNASYWILDAEARYIKCPLESFLLSQANPQYTMQIHPESVQCGFISKQDLDTFEKTGVCPLNEGKGAWE